MIIETKCESIFDFIIRYFPNFKLSDSPFQKVIAYVLDDEVIGFIIYSVIYERAEIDYFAVKEEYRGKGISKELFDYLINLLSKCGSVSLEVKCNNDRAIGFYIKNGFKKVSIRKNYYDGSDGILMVKNLEVR